MNKANQLIQNIGEKYSEQQIESSIVKSFLSINNIHSDKWNSTLFIAVNDAIPSLCEYIEKIYTDGFSLMQLEDIFEKIIDDNDKKENGIVFTPEYIVNYIIANTINGTVPLDCRVLDPSCGSGSFLIMAAEYLSNNTNKSINEIISESIYGIDINKRNVKHTKIVLSLYAALKGADANSITFNIKAADSLKEDWSELFAVKKFDYIIGNPPYVNTHNMSKRTADYLKRIFKTTVKGNFNIFYAFIEQSMKYLADNGELGFIVPNNFLTISSAEPLRKYLASNNYISKIISFGDNMVFDPVRTYNALLFLNKKNNNIFSCATLESTNNIEQELLNASFLPLCTTDLNKDGWNLLKPSDRENIKKIEKIGVPLKKYIRIGVATLKDNLYILDGYDKNNASYYKYYDGRKYFIESGMVRDIYKISNIGTESTLSDAKQYIIFPYTDIKQKSLFNNNENILNIIIPEQTLKIKFPLCYQYLSDVKPELDKRDNGKENTVAWYAYGRTQGLGLNYRKLLFPTFSAKPKFMFEESGDALFCNGYAIIEDIILPIKVLQKILNSKVMDYYVSLTSYAIEGGYKCYQKKYIERFTIPSFSPEELQYLQEETRPAEIDDFLWNKYGLSIISEETSDDKKLIDKLCNLPSGYWDFRDVDIKEYTHGIHNYPAMMVCPISRNIIRIVQEVRPISALLDPFAGSGTVLVESMLGGIATVVGNDVNPLALLLTKAKTTRLNTAEMAAECDMLFKRIDTQRQKLGHIIKTADEFICNTKQLDIADKIGWGDEAPKYLKEFCTDNNIELEIPNFKNIGYWFKPRVILDLAIIKAEIKQIKNADIRDYVFVAFSEVIRFVSNRRNGEFKMFRMQADKVRSFAPDVYEEFKKTLVRNISKMKDFCNALDERSIASNVSVYKNDACTLADIPDNTFDLIVTSLPYGDSRTTVAYGEFSRLSLQWLDLFNLSEKEIMGLDKSLMGGRKYKNGFEFALNSPTLKASLDRIMKADIERAGDVYSFYLDLDASIQSCASKTKTGGYQFWVVGNRTVKNELLPTDKIISELAVQYGMMPIYTIDRNIPNKVMPARNSPTNIAGATSSTMTMEHIVILRKK